MPSWADVAAFGVASLILVVIPGPSVLFVVGRSLALGRGGGLLSVVGNTAGVLCHVVAVALGLGALLARSAGVLTTVKLLGAAYLVYLGVQAVRHRSADLPGPAAATSRRRSVVAQGFGVGLSNPKAIVFFVAVLPQFAHPDRGPLWSQLLVLGAAFAVVALVCDSCWALTAGTVREWFARSPRRVGHLRATGGAMMIGLGGVLAATGTRT